MKGTTDIWEELRELNSSLAGAERRNAFTVPAGYFDHLADDVLAALGLKCEEELPGQQVPEGYFDGLADSILSKIRTAEAAETAGGETKRLSPLLHGLQQKRVYTVPEGYFEGLATAILQKRGGGPAKLVGMKWRSRILKYAAAAVITGVMALGAVRFMVPRTAHQLVAMNTHFSNDDFEKGLEGIGDEDIIKYLENSGDGFNTVAISDAVNEKELPSEVDLLLDDNAVDKFLNNINTNDLNN